MWQDFKDIKPYKRLNQIKCPVLAIIGGKDKHMSEEKARYFMDMIPAEHKLESVRGGDHDFLIEKAKKKAIQLTADFIKQYF